MTDNGSDTEREFFVTGAKTYLDVDDAMAEFRRVVREECTSVASQRMEEIKQACQMDWTRNSLKDYFWRAPNGFHFGKKIPVKELGTAGGLYFCLALLREDDRPNLEAVVYLFRDGASRAVELWPRLAGTPSEPAYRSNNNLTFTQRFSQDRILEFKEHLNKTVDDFIAFISSAGGLRRFLK